MAESEVAGRARPTINKHARRHQDRRPALTLKHKRTAISSTQANLLHTHIHRIGRSPTAPSTPCSRASTPRPAVCARAPGACTAMWGRALAAETVVAPRAVAAEAAPSTVCVGWGVLSACVETVLTVTPGSGASSKLRGCWRNTYTTQGWQCGGMKAKGQGTMALHSAPGASSRLRGCWRPCLWPLTSSSL